MSRRPFCTDANNHFITHSEDAKDMQAPKTLSLLSASAIFPFPSPKDLETTFAIPTKLESLETYEYIGLTPTRAAESWCRWQTLNSPFQAGFCELVTKPIARMVFLEDTLSEDAHDESDDWYALMTRWGINEELQAAIMLDEYKDLRLTQSLGFWVLEAMEMRKEALMDFWKGSRNRVTASDEGGGEEARRPAWLKNRGEESPTSSHDTTVLWKGCDMHRLKRLISDETKGISCCRWLQFDWPNEFKPLRDFRSSFVLQKEVADKYAKWAQRKAPMAQAGLLHIEIPNSLFRNFKTERWTIGDACWKQFVYRAKRKEILPNWLPLVRHFTDHRILIGPICTSRPGAIKKIPSWKDLGPEHLLRVMEERVDAELEAVVLSEVIATQYSFAHDDVCESFEKEMVSFGIWTIS